MLNINPLTRPSLKQIRRHPWMTMKGDMASTIDYFTVSCLVAWPLNESEAGVDLVLIETSLLFSC